MKFEKSNDSKHSVKYDLSEHNENTDLLRGIKASYVWGTLGWHDIRQRYRRSVLGPFWFTISTVIMVVMLGFLYASLFNQEISKYLPYLAIGLVVWQYLAASILEGCNAFIGAAYLIKQTRIPLTIHVCRIVWRNFVIMLHSLPVIIVIALYFDNKIGIEILLLPFALILLMLNGIWIGIVLGIMCARFRDLLPIITNFVQVAFFFTPVMWAPEILKSRAWVAEYNPLYYLIEIIRAPIVGRDLNLSSWVWVILTTVLGFILAQIAMNKFRNRVPYWL